MLTDGTLNELKRLVDAITPGPYFWGTHEAASHEEATAWVGESIRKSPGTDLQMVCAGDPDGDDVTPIVALTGNGPNADHNVQGICALLIAGPDLIARIRQLEAALGFYADHHNWAGHDGLSPMVPMDLDGDGVAELRYEAGALARAVLFDGKDPAEVLGGWAGPQADGKDGPVGE